MKIISNFRFQYYFLSNFYEHPLVYKGRLYQSSEAAYQAAKSPGNEHLFTSLNAGKSKRLGQKIVCRDDWNDVKIDIMRDILLVKFRDSTLQDMLLSTGDAELIEGNTWNDTFWGQCPVGTGENMLGKLLMEVREKYAMFDNTQENCDKACMYSGQFAAGCRCRAIKPAKTGVWL